MQISIAKKQYIVLCQTKSNPRTFLDVVPGGGLEEHDVGDEADGGGAPLRRVRVDPHLLLRGDRAVDADGGRRRRRVQVGRSSHVALGARWRKHWSIIVLNGKGWVTAISF